MRETITIQVGQCGNQIGNHFWQMLLNEHEKTADDDSALSAFFRFSQNVNSSSNNLSMKARALLIDMECGPLTETMRSPLGCLFDSTQFVMDVSGSGNNFAHGHYYYGPQYREKFEESLRFNAEQCDSLQTFLVTHSLGGGTGSGVGSYIIGLLEDLFPEVYRFSACVFPSEENDVVTSPYNSVLATNELLEHADCVLPIDNASLQAFAHLEAESKQRNQTLQDPRMVTTSGTGTKYTTNNNYGEVDKGFNDMNSVAARMLCHLTSSSRFHGDMNVDLNEICTNLIPYPRLKFLMSALSPQRGNNNNLQGNTSSLAHNNSDRAFVQRAFSDILSVHGQITSANPMKQRSITIASAFLARGTVPLSDFLDCVRNAQHKSLVYPSWNRSACKIGLCAVPSPGERMSVLGVYNSTAFGSVLEREHSRFYQLFKRKAMLHHYTEFCDVQYIADAEVNVKEAIMEYDDIERSASGFLMNNQRKDAQYALNTTFNEKLFPAF
jgi:tubulin epsilon